MGVQGTVSLVLDLNLVHKNDLPETYYIDLAPKNEEFIALFEKRFGTQPRISSDTVIVHLK